jgi:hypothetical protein
MPARLWLRAAALLLVASILPGAARAEACRGEPSRSGRAAATPCREEDRLRPYEPDRPRSDRAPGSIDLGNGSELRVGGRVGMDYEVRR